MNNISLITKTISNKPNTLIQSKPFSKLTQNTKSNFSSKQKVNETKNTILKEAIEYVKTGKITLKEALELLKNKIKNL